MPRTSEEIQILQEIALSGQKPSYIPESESESPFIGKLLMKDLIQNVASSEDQLNAGLGAGGWYTLTESGNSYLKMAFRLSKPTPLLEFNRKGATTIDDFTPLELVQYLSTKGWSDRVGKKKDTSPYTEGSEKLWWRKPGQKISLTYLKSLAHSEMILQKNERIFHMESKSYYLALLHGCKALPGQPLKYYQKIIKDSSSSKTKRRKTNTPASTAGVTCEEMEQSDEISNFGRIWNKSFPILAFGAWS